MWPGNPADVTTSPPAVNRQRARLHIGGVCFVADRGVISAATIAELEERKLEYIFGARERTDAIARNIVLENDDPFVPLLIKRETGQTQLFIKQVKVEGRRYIVRRNEAEAEMTAPIARPCHNDADGLVRVDVSSMVAALFQRAHVALPPRAYHLRPPPIPAAKRLAKRRGRPRRSGATP